MAASTVATGVDFLSRYRSGKAWRTITGTTPTSTTNVTTMLWPTVSTSTANSSLYIASSSVGDIQAGSTLSQGSYDSIISAVQNPVIRAGVDDSVLTLQTNLIAEVFSGNGIPTSSITSVTTGVANVIDNTSDVPSNLARTDRLNFTLTDYSSNVIGTSTCYMWTPTSPNGNLMVYVYGHRGTTAGFAAAEQQPFVRRLVEANYTVAGLFMPFTIAPSCASVSLHNSMPDAVSTLNYLKFFVEMPIRTVNHFSAAFSKFFISGLSGGGFTVPLVQAIDGRFSAGVAIAGSFPLYIFNSLRDKEQFLPGFEADDYAQAMDYPDLYILACSSNRYHKQILGDHDPDFPAYTIGTTVGASWSTQVIAATSGRYSYVIHAAATHEITGDMAADAIAFFSSH